MFDLEEFWAEILSRDAERVRAAYRALPDDSERAAVYDHLLSMAMEDDWAEVQRLSAEAALMALQSLMTD